MEENTIIFLDWNDEIWFLSTYIAKLILSFGFLLKYYKWIVP